MALQIGDKVTHTLNSPFFYNQKEYVVTGLYELTKADIGKKPMSPGVYRMVKSGKTVLIAITKGESGQESRLPARFFKKVKK